MQVELDGCGDDQELGDVQLPSERHRGTLQTAQGQFIAPRGEPIGRDTPETRVERDELEFVVGGVSRRQSCVCRFRRLEATEEQRVLHHVP